MKKIILLLHLLFLSIFIYSQEDYISFYLRLNEASNFSKQDCLEKADSVYIVAFASVSIIHPEDYIKAAINSCKMDSLNKVSKYLLTAASNGYPLKQMKASKLLTPFFKSKYSASFKNEYIKVREKYESKLDKELSFRINNMYENDQKYRGRINSKNFHQQNSLDSLNLIEIKKLQAEYGKVPGLKEVGYEGVMLIYIILRHVEDIYAINVLGPQIIEQSKNGDFPPYMGPSMIDYKAFMQVSSKQYYMTCQIYGTQIMTTPKTRTRVIIPVKDINNINLLRENIGLGKMEDYSTAIYDETLVKEECGDAFEFCKE